jgi:hypothetical protein
MDLSNRGALKVGGIVGLIGALLSLVLGFVALVPLCGCLAGMANWLVPAGAGLTAGLVAATRADWSEVPPEGRTGFGVGLGLRAGGVAAALSAIGFVLVSFLSPLVTAVMNVVLYGASTDVIVATLIGSLIGIAVAMGICLGSTLMGVILGVAGGAIVGSTKGNEG